MAKVYIDSKHLEKQLKKETRKDRALRNLMRVGGVLWSLMKKNPYVFMVTLLTELIEIEGEASDTTKKFTQGLKGELEVFDTLRKDLNDDFHVRKGYIIPGNGDIDFLVIGPNGIFIIEVKNLKGWVSYEDGEFVHKKYLPGGKIGNVASRDPCKQARTQAFLLREHLETLRDNKNKKFRIPYIKCIVVFASDTKFESDGSEIETVLRPDTLCDFIENHTGIINPNWQKNIEKLVRRWGDILQF